MVWEPVFWLIFSSMNLLLLVSNLYQFLGFSDLESDYMNPYELSSRVNSVILLEYVLHLVFSVLFLVMGHWIMFLISVPVAYYNIKQYMSRQHLIDVTEVFRVVTAEKKVRLVKVVYYGVFLAIVIAKMIFSIVSVVFEEDVDQLHGYGIP